MKRYLLLVSLGIALALLSGLFVLAGQSMAVGPTGPAVVFSIAPGDAERVPFDRDDGICTLAEAIEAANDQGMSDPPLNDCGSAGAGSNVIELEAGNYDLTAQVAVINGGNTATFNITSPITVRGVTSDTTKIRRTAEGEFRFFHVGSNGFLTLEDLALEGGYANGGTGGGAVHVASGGTLLLTRAQMLANTARYGGALYSGGQTTIVESSFLGNSASENDASQGGAIYVSNQVTITASSVTGNESTQHGGGIYVDSTGSGALWISLSNISNNAANSDLSDGGDGGGIYLHNGTLTSTLNSLTANAASPSAQAAEPSKGGGIFASGDLNLFFTLVDTNAAERGGGLFNATPAKTVVTGTLFIANLAAQTGGGIANEGALDLDNAIVWANVAQEDGGGLHNRTLGAPFANIRNSTFYQNEAVAGSGGGIYNLTGASAWSALSNVTVANNSAAISGGGIANGDEGRMVIASATVANNNTAGSGGGIASSNPIADDARIRNTLLSGNTAAANSATNNCSGALASQDYNLDSGVGCAFAGSGDIINGNAGLDALAPSDPLLVLQGDITPAYGLLAGSDAINAGNPAGCYDARNLNNNGDDLLTDQWGAARVQNGRCDIGAIESQETNAVALAGFGASAASGAQTVLWQIGLGLVMAALLAYAVRVRRMVLAGRHARRSSEGPSISSR